MAFTIYTKNYTNDCEAAKTELSEATVANLMYYIDWNVYAPDIGSLIGYNYTPTELSTGYIEYGVSGNGQVAGVWEGSIRNRPCPGTSGAGRWTMDTNAQMFIWRNNSELQSWRNSLGI